MIHIARLINSYFWKSYFGVFFAFVFPLILLGLLGSMLGYHNLFSGIFAIPSTAVALISMPTAIFQFKNSVLFKRIGITKIKPYQFILVIGMFYFVIMLIATLWCFLWTIIFFNQYWNLGRQFSDMNPNVLAPSLHSFFQKASWGGFIYGLTTNILVGITLGMLLLANCKNILSLQAIGTTIMIINQFLSCQVLPVAMVESNSVIKILSYFSPFKYSTGLIIESLTGNWSLDGTQFIINPSNVFNIHQDFLAYYDKPSPTLIYSLQDKVANLTAPFAFMAVFSASSIKTFKWMVR